MCTQKREKIQPGVREEAVAGIHAGRKGEIKLIYRMQQREEEEEGEKERVQRGGIRPDSS